jgi:butyryl-CoA dehydrogenase
MDFDLTQEQAMVRKQARDFAEKEIAPIIKECERKESFPREVINKMAELGFLGAPIPEKYQGAGLDHISYGLICEEIGRISASVFTTTLTVQVSLVGQTILQCANEEQKQKYLTRLCNGKNIGCFGLTEPNVGSDPVSMETAAVQKGNNWVINGNKMWISNGGIADFSLLFAQTDKSKAHKGTAAFIVERAFPGFNSKDIHGKLGLHASNTAELSLQDCQVPAENMVGKIGDGFKIAMMALDNGRFSTAACCVGIAQACIDASVSYAQQRKQFGKPIGSFQMIQDMIVDMVVETEAARFLVLRVGHLKDKKMPHTREAAMAKYYAAETAVKIAKHAIQVHGGYGYSDEYPVERYLRDAMGLVLYEGTSQVQKLIIGRETLGLRAFV